MNSFSENELLDKLHTDDYQVVIVVQEYQTVFDDLVVQIMCVDKTSKEIIDVK
ncbi:hypothetical protein FGV23_002001 [Enterococcus faecalis]|uniref:hypothetical protein n=1 Tax=Enterococcus faecalis TaxID=1351 RepID=UPI0015E3B3C5|nr:hypothetical protein [Enterococcus faecalis]EGO7887215.1 hypothetical protein [Enterococcus faecalis]